MTRRLLRLVVPAILCSLAASGVATAVTPQLTLNLSVANLLEVTFPNGTTIRASSAAGATLAPGAYEVVVNNDVPDIKDVVHNFHLSGPGVNLQTDMGAGDNKTEVYTVQLAASSTYTFQDDRQPSLAHVVFATTAAVAAGSSSTTTSGSSTTKGSGSSSNSGVVGSKLGSTVQRGALAGTVSTAGKASLTRNGKAVETLKAGIYRLTVDDRSGSSGFSVQAVRKPPTVVTGTTFTGRRTATLSLQAGQWLYFGASSKRSYFVVVS